MNNVAVIYRMQGKYAEAEALYRQTLEIQRRTLGPEHPYTLLSMGNLADAEGLLGRYPESEALFSKTIEMCLRLGPGHPFTLPPFQTSQPCTSDRVTTSSRGPMPRRSSQGDGTKRNDRDPGPLPSGPSPRMDRAALSGVGQAGEGGRVDE